MRIGRGGGRPEARPPGTGAGGVGAPGVLGSSLRRGLGRRAAWSVAEIPPLPWDAGTEAVRAAARAGAERLVAEATPGERWAVLWAGGATVTASSDDAAELELVQLGAALDGMRAALTAHP